MNTKIILGVLFGILFAGLAIFFCSSESLFLPSRYGSGGNPIKPPVNCIIAGAFVAMASSCFLSVKGERFEKVVQSLLGLAFLSLFVGLVIVNPML